LLSLEYHGVLKQKRRKKPVIYIMQMVLSQKMKTLKKNKNKFNSSEFLSGKIGPEWDIQKYFLKTTGINTSQSNFTGKG
jgi:hypothetical protein